MLAGAGGAGRCRHLCKNLVARELVLVIADKALDGADGQVHGAVRAIARNVPLQTRRYTSAGCELNTESTKLNFPLANEKLSVPRDCGLPYMGEAATDGNTADTTDEMGRPVCASKSCT